MDHFGNGLLWKFSKNTRNKLCGVKFSDTDFTDLTATDKLECHRCVYVPIGVHLIPYKVCVDCVGLIDIVFQKHCHFI